jgi:putative ABC transport system substrate-binding protein
MTFNRRDFITLLGGAAAAWPLAARAQQAGRMRRIAMLAGGSVDDPVWQRYTAAFRDALAKLGWNDGGNVRIELGFADGDAGRARAAAAELLRGMPDVILASSGFAARAALQRTQTIPIVTVGPAPEAMGVKNIARPEGNMTGFPVVYQSMAGKWLELLKEADPHVTRAAVIDGADPLRPARSGYIPFIEEAAPVLGVRLVEVMFASASELERAVDTFAAQAGGSLIALPSAATSTRESRRVMRQLAEKHRLLAIHWDDAYPAEGGLMSYGSNLAELHRRAAAYVDRILRGAKISELPVERPSKFELIVNVKAASAIGLTISEPFLARADQVIEQ